MRLADSAVYNKPGSAKPNTTQQMLETPSVNRASMKILLIALGFIGLVMALAPASIAEQPFPTLGAYWEDKSGAAAYEEASRAQFQPFAGSLAKGYSSSAIWLKLRISGREGTEPLAVIVRPAFLNNIALYDPQLEGERQPPRPIFSGRDAMIERSNHVGLDNGFVIPSSPVHRDIFLRITTTTALTVKVSVKSLSEAERDGHLLEGTLSIYLAFLLVFWLWGLVNWAVRGEAIYGLFALRQIYSALHIFVWFGLLKYFLSGELSPSTRDFIYCFVTITILPVAGLFDARLLADFGATGWPRKILLAILSFAPLSLLPVMMGHPQTALQINALVVAISMPVILLLAFSVHDKEKKPYGSVAVWVIRGGYAQITLVIFVPTLMYQNVIGSNVPVLNVLFAHAVISTVVLFAILSIRGRQRDVLAQNALIQYGVKSRELDQENARRIEKERFLSMLTHELRNPLTVISLMANTNSSSGKAVQKAATDIAKVIERVEQSEKVEDQQASISKSPLELRKFIVGLVEEQALASWVDLDIPAGSHIVTDENILASVLRNLLDNATKYGAAGSRIKVSAQDGACEGVDGMTLTVSNELGDVEPPYANKVFVKYYRAHGAHRHPGSGLGLFLVAGWVKALGGRTSYRHHLHTEGRASVAFSVWLPA